LQDVAVELSTESVLGLRAVPANLQGCVVGLAAVIRVCSRPSGLAAHAATRSGRIPTPLRGTGPLFPSSRRNI